MSGKNKNAVKLDHKLVPTSGALGSRATTAGASFSDISHRKVALVAGFAFLIMTIAAIFTIYFVFENLMVPGNAAATANNVMSSELLFRTGIFSLIIVLICDVLVAWALYIFLKQVNKSLSLLMAWLRLVYSVFIGIALLNLVNILLLISGADYLLAFKTDQLHAQVLLLFNAFNDIWGIGLVIFGLHLFSLGYLIIESGYIPKFLGILIIIASFGYLITNLGNLLLSNYENYEAIIILVFIVPMFLGELGLALWLIFKGGIIPLMDADKESKSQ